MQVLLYAPEYRPNLSNMIRSAEFFGFSAVWIFDSNGLLDPPNNKVSRADMNHLARVWTAGAIEHVDIRKIDDIHDFLRKYAGRKVATLVDSGAKHLPDFSFEPDDLLIMGPEKEGLPKNVLLHTDESVFIPGTGKTDCLNVSVSLGILLYAAAAQRPIRSVKVI